MRRLVKFFFTLVAMFCLISCEGNRVDPRDAFVGEYSFAASGSVDLYMGATKLYTVPLDETGTFTITKAEEDGEVLIIGYNDTIHASVSGKHLLFESTTTNYEYEGVKLQMTFVYGKATLEENQLHWNTDVQATGSYGAFSASGTGQIAVVATKRE